MHLSGLLHQKPDEWQGYAVSEPLTLLIHLLVCSP
jgi:hypothetical protein